MSDSFIVDSSASYRDKPSIGIEVANRFHPRSAIREFREAVESPEMRISLSAVWEGRSVT